MAEIAVILPVYNGGRYLKFAVESVLHQSWQNFEFYIVDDCSTDDSYDYLRTLKDKRIKLIRNEVNRGLFYNLNLLIQSSNSPLIKIWSQDDIMYPHCLEKTVLFHEKYPQIGFSYSERHIIDENGKILKRDRIDKTPEIIPTDLHSKIAFYVGSIAGNIANVTLVREALNRVGVFKEHMRISGDFDMWVRLARYYRTGFIKTPLIQLRDHKSQLSRQEKYYIYHLEEDIEVYEYLFSYISEGERFNGRIMLRNYKLMFYYTLMLKSLVKGRFRTFFKFYRALSRFDNMRLLTMCFVKRQLFQRKLSKSFYTDNSPIIETES